MMNEISSEVGSVQQASAEEERETKGGSPSVALFTFKGSDENIYGRYLRATYNTEKENGWIAVMIVMALCWIFALFIILNPGMFGPSAFYGSPSLGHAPMTPSRYLYGETALYWGWITLFVAPLTCIYVGGGLAGSWEAHNNFWARLYRWSMSLSRSAGGKVFRMLYFGSFEKKTSDILIFDSYMLVGENEKTREVVYFDIGRAFFCEGLFVFRILINDTVVDYAADITSLSREEKADFVDFIRAKVREEVKVYIG